MAQTGDDDTTFRLLRDEYPLFLKAAGQSEKLATKLVQRFLEGGERDRFDGRLRYKIWRHEAFSGGLEPKSSDGDFWCSYPERGVYCTIEPWNSSAHWTGPTSARWKEFDGRQIAEHQVFGIRLNHEIVVEFLQSAGMLPEQPSEQPSELASATPTPEQAQRKQEQPMSEVELARELIGIAFPNGEWEAMKTGTVEHDCGELEAVKKRLKELKRDLPKRGSFGRAMGRRK
jgi:hypothetical protein